MCYRGLSELESYHQNNVPMQHGKESSQIEYPKKPKYPGLQKIPQSNHEPVSGVWASK